MGGLDCPVTASSGEDGTGVQGRKYQTIKSHTAGAKSLGQEHAGMLQGLRKDAHGAWWEEVRLSLALP